MNQEIKSLTDKFDSMRLVYDKDIDSLSQVIQFGEHLLDIAYQSELKDVASYVAHCLLIPYDERARYYRHYGKYDRAKHPKDLEQSIRDYSRVIDLAPVALNGKTDDHYGKIRLAFEGRCECFLEIDVIDRAISDAEFIIKKYGDSQAYILRSKCYFSAKDFDLANRDIIQAIEIIKNKDDITNQWNLSDAIEMQNKIRAILNKTAHRLTAVSRDQEKTRPGNL